MIRSTRLRFAAIVSLAVVTAVLTAASAWAFSQGNGGTGEGSNSSFADPDEQVGNIFGFGFDQGPQPSGLNGSVQVSPQQGQLTQFKHFQIDSLTSPPDPLSRPSH